MKDGPDFSFSDLCRTSQVSKQVRKALPYSISHIGGSSDYARFKAEWEAMSIQKKALWLSIEHHKREKAVDAFMGGSHMAAPIASPKPSNRLMDGFKSLCAKIWRNAFDSERK